MNRSRGLALFLAILPGAFYAHADVQELYKWTDANGRLHYGDRAAAPESSRKIDVPAAAPRQAQLIPAPSSSAPRRAVLPPTPDVRKKTMQVDPAGMGPACKGLIDKIAAVPAGVNWESLSRQFDSACPGIADDCVEYRSSPQNNRCVWVQRSGGRILNRREYP